MRTDSVFTTIGAYQRTIGVISVIEISLSVQYQFYQRNGNFPYRCTISVYQRIDFVRVKTDSTLIRNC